MQPQNQLLTLFLANGILMSAIAIPLIRNRVPRNPWYGFRVPKTLASDAVWYPANCYMGRWLLACGLIDLVGVLLLWPFAAYLSVETVAGVGLALTVIPLAITLYKGFRFLDSL